MKPDTFDSKPSLLPSTPIPSPPFQNSPYLLLNSKNSENSLCLKKFDEIKRTKYHASELELSVWFIQIYTYFYQTVRFTKIYHFNIYRCIYNHTRWYPSIYMCVCVCVYMCVCVCVCVCVVKLLSSLEIDTVMQVQILNEFVCISLAFHLALIPLRMVCIQRFSLQLCANSWAN